MPRSLLFSTKRPFSTGVKLVLYELVRETLVERAPVSQRGEHFVQQCVIGAPNTAPPVGLARASRQLSGDIDQGSTVHRRDKPVAV